jgi:arginine deiminase
VDTEHGRLRAVLVHRPGDELRAVSVGNAREMLFGGPVSVERARQEHDAFTGALRARGVEVLYVEQLLAEVAADPQRRTAVIGRALAGASASVGRRLATRSPRRLARALIGGLPHTELAAAGGARPDPPVLEPLPNLLFTRDPSVWMADGVLLGTPASAIRRREAALVAAIYTLHPRFSDRAAWTHGADPPIGVEGGDVLVAAPGRVAVGISPRTSAAAAHRLATTLLIHGGAEEVLTVQIPRGGGFHLDLVLAMVDRDTCAVWAPLRHALRAHQWRATSAGVAVRAVRDPFAWLAATHRIIEIGGRRRASHDAAWERGVNVLAVAPGVVVAYDHHTSANARLAAAGIEVIGVPGRTLVRGCGGPRCLTCPLERDPPPD